MHQFSCFRCFQVSTSVEGLRCLLCDGDSSATLMAENFDSSLPEYGNAGPEYYVTVEDASTQVSEEDFLPVEPTRETSTQTNDDDLPLQITGSHGYENCLKSDGRSQNQASHDFDECTNVNQNSLLTNSNTNEGEFHNQSNDMCNAETSMVLTDDKITTSPQTFLCERSSVEGENEYSSIELLRTQGTKEHIKHAISSESFVERRSKRRCGKCGRYFLKEWTFYAHLQNYCNPWKPYECGECALFCRNITRLLLHKRVHTGEKHFKCTQCDYASARPDHLKNHMKTHTNLPSSFSQISRKKSSQ